MKKTIICCLFSLLLLCGTAYGFTNNNFIVNESEDETFFIDSFPKEMNNIPERNYQHFLVCFVRKKGVWNLTNGTFAGTQDCSDYRANCSYLKIVALMKALDEIIPKDEGIISFSYILCYHDAVIYFERNYSYGKMCWIASKLNNERQNNIERLK